MLTEQQCSRIEAGLTENVEPRKVAAYLCLHMGLMLAEVAALWRQDIDILNGSITLHNYLGKPNASKKACLLPMDKPRMLPIPPHVRRYLEENERLYPSGDCFILSGTTTIPAFHMMQNVLTSVKIRQKVGVAFSASDLRNAFIRRCIQSGMDLYSLCTYVGIKQPNVIVKRFDKYFSPQLNKVDALEEFSRVGESDSNVDSVLSKRMNLLILGAGSQGPVVKEIAEAIGIFDEIAYVDDNPNNSLAIGKLRDISKLHNRFPMAIASFGDSHMREKWLDLLGQNGYIVPSLVHPNATISPNARIGPSVVIEARCIVSAGAVIGRGALLSSASVVETNARIGQFVHIGSSVTVAKEAVVQDYERVPSGFVVRA